MSRPTLLDLFCGEGGASYGYQLAGFEVTGVDLARRCAGRYPGRFIRGDAIKFAQEHAGEFDVVTGSPPCKVHTVAAVIQPQAALDTMLFPMATHIDLIPETRAAMIASGKPWVIENVPGAPLRDPITLCGTSFGLGAMCADGEWRQLRRHRLFEANVMLYAPLSGCRHEGGTVSVFGHGAGGERPNGGYYGNRQESRDAIGAPWMSREGISQAIPPAYTQWLGAQLMEHLGYETGGTVIGANHEPSLMSQPIVSAAGHRKDAETVVVSPACLTRSESGLIRGPSDRSRDRHPALPYVDETFEQAIAYAGGA